MFLLSPIRINFISTMKIINDDFKHVLKLVMLQLNFQIININLKHIKVDFKDFHTFRLIHTKLNPTRHIRN